MPPAFVGILEDITTNTDPGMKTAVVTWSVPTTSDRLATITSSHSPGQAFPIGKTTVTYTATDAANNRATESFVVTVIGTVWVRYFAL